MKLLIYAPAARMGGARAHLLGLVPELAKIAPEDQVLLLAQPDLIEELPPLPPSWQVRAERVQKRGFFGRLLWEQRRLPRIAEAWGADVLLSFGAFVPLRCPCPTVLEAGNALYFTPAYWQIVRTMPLRFQLEEHLRWALLWASLRSSARVLAPTRAMRQDVVGRVPELADRVDVALWGVAPVFKQVRWTQPEGCSVLGVSKHGINKEFDILVRALSRLDPVSTLVLTGTPEESQWSRATASLAARLGLDGRVRFVGDIPNPRIPELICQARVLVFPTWCESFGLPLAEALAMGAPAIAADIPACREVGGDAARYYSPGDASSLAAAIDDVLHDSGALAESAYQRGKTYDWHANAVAVRNTLQRAIDG